MHHSTIYFKLAEQSPCYSTKNEMEGCISTVQVTPPMEDKPAFTQHILWAPKKKRLHRRVISADLPSGARPHTHSKIRKRLIFPCPEESERKDKEEVPSNMPECKKESNIGEKHSARTPDCSGARDKRNGNCLHLDLSKATLKTTTNQKGVRNVDPQRIKRKLALSSFRWETKHFKTLNIAESIKLNIGIQLSKIQKIWRRKKTLTQFETAIFWKLRNFAAINLYE